MSISYFSNGVWVFLALIGIMFSFFINESILLSFYSLGFFISIGIRFLVFTAAICNSFKLSLPLAILQPLLLASTTLLLNFPTFPSKWVQYFMGIVFIFSIILYSIFMNNASKDKSLPSLQLLRSFLEAWATDKPDFIEEILEKKSRITYIKTKVLSFFSKNARPIIVVSDVHAGPFSLVGSSNIPYELQKWFTQENYSPLILHSFSSHDLNLPSKNQVLKLLSSLHNRKNEKEVMQCTKIITSTVGHATIKGINFDGIALIIITLAPHGMEDFPRFVGEKIEECATKIGYNNIILVDSHNSQGETLTDSEHNDVIEASKNILIKLKDEIQYPFKVSFCHSSEFGVKIQQDVGPGGIGVLLFEIKGTRNFLVGVDANNAIIGLRDNVITNLKNSGINILEICTSDTHVTSGKVRNDLGYFPLGDLTDPEILVDLLLMMCKKAEERLQQANLTLQIVNTEIKVMGKSNLDEFSQIVDRTLSVAKRGGKLIIFELIILILISSLF